MHLNTNLPLEGLRIQNNQGFEELLSDLVFQIVDLVHI